MNGNLLIDTGAFIALLDADDDLHLDADACYRSLPPATLRLTTQSIVGECYTFFRYRVGAKAARRWLDFLDEARASGHLRVIYSDVDDGRRAEQILRRFDDQTLSYTDALSLAMAANHDIQAIFAFDHHLALTGVPLLPGRLSRSVRDG